MDENKACPLALRTSSRSLRIRSQYAPNMPCPDVPAKSEPSIPMMTADRNLPYCAVCSARRSATPSATEARSTPGSPTRQGLLAGPFSRSLQQDADHGVDQRVPADPRSEIAALCLRGQVAAHGAKHRILIWRQVEEPPRTAGRRGRLCLRVLSWPSGKVHAPPSMGLVPVECLVASCTDRRSNDDGWFATLRAGVVSVKLGFFGIFEAGWTESALLPTVGRRRLRWACGQAQEVPGWCEWHLRERPA